nr:MAG TPA: hypothetical protein [Caudoviricetes sp.]
MKQCKNNGGAKNASSFSSHDYFMTVAQLMSVAKTSGIE